MMKTRKRQLILAFTIITILLVLLYIQQASKKNDMTTEIDNTSIRSLIYASLNTQYNQDELSLNQIYTDQFIENISDDIFYKSKLAPYKLLDEDFYEISPSQNSNLLIYSIHIEDRGGTYHQIIHITKQGNHYRISQIEYDS